MRKIVSALVLVAAIAVAPAAASSVAVRRGGSPLADVDPSAYRELSARWWQWAASTPMSDTGPFGQFGTDCGQNQPRGTTWFLAGQFTAPAERRCRIPARTRLFIPVINLECSSLEAPPFFGASVADRRACLQSPKLAFTPLVAELDGTPIVGDFGPYTVTSPNFRLVAVAGNPALIPPGAGFSVSAGTWLLLAPLSPGVHTLHVVGAVPAFDFVSTATYELTVEP